MCICSSICIGNLHYKMFYILLLCNVKCLVNTIDIDCDSTSCPACNSWLLQGTTVFYFIYSWCKQVLWSPQMVRKNTFRRWDLQLEVRSPIGGDTSNQRWDLQLEVRSPIGGPTSNWRWHLQLEVLPPIRGVTSDWRHPCYMYESVILLKKEIIYCWLHQAITCLPGEM